MRWVFGRENDENPRKIEHESRRIRESGDEREWGCVAGWAGALGWGGGLDSRTRFSDTWGCMGGWIRGPGFLSPERMGAWAPSGQVWPGM